MPARNRVTGLGMGRAGFSRHCRFFFKRAFSTKTVASPSLAGVPFEDNLADIQKYELSAF